MVERHPALGVEAVMQLLVSRIACQREHLLAQGMGFEPPAPQTRNNCLVAKRLVSMWGIASPCRQIAGMPPRCRNRLIAIRTWLEADAKDNIHVEIENSSTSGDSVKATAKVQAYSLPPDLTLVGAVEVTVKDGKIMSFTYTLDDATLAKLAELEGK
jgi:hypothetical protein